MGVRGSVLCCFTEEKSCRDSWPMRWHNSLSWRKKNQAKRPTWAPFILIKGKWRYHNLSCVIKLERENYIYLDINFNYKFGLQFWKIQYDTLNLKKYTPRYFYYLKIWKYHQYFYPYFTRVGYLCVQIEWVWFVNWNCILFG